MFHIWELATENDLSLKWVLIHGTTYVIMLDDSNWRDRLLPPAVVFSAIEHHPLWHGEWEPAQVSMQIDKSATGTCVILRSYLHSVQYTVHVHKPDWVVHSRHTVHRPTCKYHSQCVCDSLMDKTTLSWQHHQHHQYQHWQHSSSEALAAYQLHLHSNHNEYPALMSHCDKLAIEYTHCSHYHRSVQIFNIWPKWNRH